MCWVRGRSGGTLVSFLRQRRAPAVWVRGWRGRRGGGGGGVGSVGVDDGGLGPEDLKIITLARSARARVGAAEGAAVRDETGRTYAAATVALPSLQLSALG